MSDTLRSPDLPEDEPRTDTRRVKVIRLPLLNTCRCDGPCGQPVQPDGPQNSTHDNTTASSNDEALDEKTKQKKEDKAE